jgi:hypothetical protein
MWYHHRRRQTQFETRLETLPSERAAAAAALAFGTDPEKLTRPQQLAYEGKRAWRESIHPSRPNSRASSFGSSFVSRDAELGVPMAEYQHRYGASPVPSTTSTATLMQHSNPFNFPTQDMQESRSITPKQYETPHQGAKLLATQSYGFHLPRPQAGRARTYSLTIKAEQNFNDGSIPPPVPPMPQTARNPEFKENSVHNSNRKLRRRSASFSAVDFRGPGRITVAFDVPPPPQPPRIVKHRRSQSGFVVSRPSSAVSSRTSFSTERSGARKLDHSASSSVDLKGLGGNNIGPSWHRERMARASSSGS